MTVEIGNRLLSAKIGGKSAKIATIRKTRQVLSVLPKSKYWLIFISLKISWLQVGIENRLKSFRSLLGKTGTLCRLYTPCTCHFAHLFAHFEVFEHFANFSLAIAFQTSPLKWHFKVDMLDTLLQRSCSKLCI